MTAAGWEGFKAGLRFLYWVAFDAGYRVGWALGCRFRPSHGVRRWTR